MTQQVAGKRSVTLARVVHHSGRRYAAPSVSVADRREFSLGEAVRSLVQVNNDGICPRKDIGESLVQQGDAGAVREKWSFLGEIYYTVQFAQRATVVIMRGREMTGAV